MNQLTNKLVWSLITIPDAGENDEKMNYFWMSAFLAYLLFVCENLINFNFMFLDVMINIWRWCKLGLIFLQFEIL